MSQLLNDLMDLLGYDATQSVKLTSDLTDPKADDQTISDSNNAPSDPPDRFDLKKRDQDGKFRIGSTYRGRRIERICAMSPADRAATDAAGWPRAGAVVIHGVGLLVDDVTRLMIDGRFLVLGYVDFADRQQISIPPSGRKRGGR